MWARVVEVMLGIWLALSPFIFPAGSDSPSQWLMYGLGTVVATLALLSYWRPTARAHLLLVAVALGMCLWGRFGVANPGPGYQNLITVGFVLVMFAIIPNECLQPPRVWRQEEAPAG